MIYVTSQPVSEAIIEYYLGLLSGVIPSHARARLTLVAGRRRIADVAELRSCWRDHDCCARSGRMIPNPERCHLIPYNTTPLERDVALSLGIPMYGADPRLVGHGQQDRVSPDV